jgi:hypothetical protein
MESNNPSKVSIRKRATDELKEFAVIAANLYICFTAILYAYSFAVTAPINATWV